MTDLMTILARWENWIFAVPALVALVFMALQLVGFGMDALSGAGHEHDIGHGHGHSHDVGHSHDAGPGHVHADGASHEHDHDAGHGHEHGDPGHDHDHDHDGHIHHGHDGHEGPGTFSSLLTWLNFGRAPFMILCEVLLLSFGAFGVLGVTLLRSAGNAQGWLAVALTAPAALVAAAFTTKLTGGALGRLLPTFETKRVTARSLVGMEAEVESAEITAEGGRASVKDARGDLYTVFCRLAPGAPPARRNERVLLVGYQADIDRYTVKPVAGSPAPGENTGGPRT